jgi:hypothetical protein
VKEKPPETENIFGALDDLSLVPGSVPADIGIKTCPICHATHDRDILAANNIKRFAFVKQNTSGGTGGESGEMPVNKRDRGTRKSQERSWESPAFRHGENLKVHHPYLFSKKGESF